MSASYMLKSLAASDLCMPVFFAQVRVTQAVDDQQRVQLLGSRHPLAVRQYDAGAVAPEMALGRTVDEAPAGRRSIVFSGTASQVESAFHTELRHYRVNGIRHLANASGLEIPQALAGLVAGISTLHDFGRQPLHSERITAEMNSFFRLPLSCSRQF